MENIFLDDLEDVYDDHVFSLAERIELAKAKAIQNLAEALYDEEEDDDYFI